MSNRTDAPDLSTGAEDKSLHPDQDKTLLSDGGPTGDEDDDDTPAPAPAAGDPTVEVEFLYHHQTYCPGDRAALPVRDAATLVKAYRARYVTS